MMFHFRIIYHILVYCHRLWEHCQNTLQDIWCTMKARNEDKLLLQIHIFLTYITQTFIHYIRHVFKSNYSGVGSATARRLAEFGVVTMTDLQQCPLEDLKRELGGSTAVTIKELSEGIDENPVIPYSKPQVLSHVQCYYVQFMESTFGILWIIK